MVFIVSSLMKEIKFLQFWQSLERAMFQTCSVGTGGVCDVGTVHKNQQTRNVMWNCINNFLGKYIMQGKCIMQL